MKPETCQLRTILGCSQTKKSPPLRAPEEWGVEEKGEGVFWCSSAREKRHAQADLEQALPFRPEKA